MTHAQKQRLLSEIRRRAALAARDGGGRVVWPAATIRRHIRAVTPEAK